MDIARKRKDLGHRFYRVIESLFRELDQQSIMAEVEALQKKKPAASREQIAKELINRTAKKTALVGATAGIPGGSFGLLAAAPDIFNLVRAQSRLVLSIAFLYDQKPGLEERFREVLAVLALSTGASATRQGVRYLIAKGLTGKTAESIMKKVAGRFMARKIPSIAPLVGSVAGAGLNYMAVRATGKIAIDYYSSELERQTPSPSSGSASGRTARRKGTAKKALAKKVSSKKKATGKKKISKKSGTKKSAAKKSSGATGGRKGSKPRTKSARRSSSGPTPAGESSGES